MEEVISLHTAKKYIINLLYDILDINDTYGLIDHYSQIIGHKKNLFSSRCETHLVDRVFVFLRRSYPTTECIRLMYFDKIEFNSIIYNMDAVAFDKFVNYITKTQAKL